MTDETTVAFNNSIENVEYSKDLSYLLNFWHTTKLNKEYEFIKRNGIHPSVIPIEKRGSVDVGVKDGNSIQTNFYTVFRIFIENLFDKEVKAAKERNNEEWTITFQNPMEGLNSKPYLLMHYAKSNNLPSDVFEHVTYARYGMQDNNSPSPFKIKLRHRDQLHSRKILNTLEDWEVHAQANIDQAITLEANQLMSKIQAFLDFPKAKLKSKFKPIVGELEDMEVPVGLLERARPEVVVPMGTVNTGLNELLPIYRQLNPSITGMDTRVRFSFILNYAQQGTNMVINRLENSQANYNEFMRLTNNMTA